MLRSSCLSILCYTIFITITHDIYFMSRRNKACQEEEKFVKKKRSVSRRREVCQEEEKFVKKEKMKFV